MKRTLSIVLTLIFFLCALSVQAADIRIGVLAKNGPAKVMKKWSATGDYLSAKLGKSVEIIPLDFDKVNPASYNFV